MEGWRMVNLEKRGREKECREKRECAFHRQRVK
jgi:hypothetical protein